MNAEQNPLQALAADAATQIVVAAISRGQSVSDGGTIFSQLYGTIYQTLGGAPAAPEKVELVPAVSIKKSVQPDYIVCLDDGKKFKSLKRHLTTFYGITPDEYRAKWGLPKDYPMVAPNYAEQRSQLAKNMGLGRKPGQKLKNGRVRGVKKAA